MNHKKLTEHAKFWLKSAKQCNPVFSEQGSKNIKEMPDAIGFKSDSCIIVECKTSKSDLNADHKKSFRESGGLGDERYFCFTKKLYHELFYEMRDGECGKNTLFKKECTFDFKGWGVIVCDEYGQIRQARDMKSGEFESNIMNERHFLRSRILEIQRFGQ